MAYRYDRVGPPVTQREKTHPDATPRSLVERSAARIRRTATLRRLRARAIYWMTFGVAKPTTIVDMRVGKSGRLEVAMVRPESFADMSPVQRAVAIAIMTGWAVSLAVGAGVVVKWIVTGTPF